MSSVPFPDLATIPSALREEVARRRNLSVYRMLMHTPAVAPGFLAMTDALRQHNTLPVALRELAILRVGRRYDAPYEVHHHERMARAGGLGEPGIAAAGVGPGVGGLAPDERLVLTLTDELLDTHRLGAESRARALERFDLNQLADLVLTVGHYQQVCGFLSTFEVPIEP